MGGVVGGAGARRPDIETAVGAAEVHALLCAVAERTGDLSLLRDELAPDQAQLLTPGWGLSPEQIAEARALAADALAAHEDAGGPERPLTRDELRQILGFLVGASSTDHWEGFLTEELALAGTDPRAPTWHLDEVGGTFRCAVIGAGASGLAAAHRLRQAGVTVTVFEKNDDVGGTWLENVYPGCRVDVPNQLYSFSFAQTNGWASRFSSQPDLLAYLQEMAKELGLGDCIRFRSEVTEARYDDAARRWTLAVRGADGTEVAEEFDAVVCAVGQLNRPSFPAIAGRDSFAGPSFHSAAWDETVELAGRRVAVIGTGASAAQFVPLIAGDVAHLDVFQRTPPWLLPTDNYGNPFPPEFHDLLSLLPNYGRW
jgi:4-hydroxyacetophenone monooxygenase